MARILVKPHGLKVLSEAPVKRNTMLYSVQCHAYKNSSEEEFDYMTLDDLGYKIPDHFTLRLSLFELFIGPYIVNGVECDGYLDYLGDMFEPEVYSDIGKAYQAYMDLRFEFPYAEGLFLGNPHTSLK